MSESMISERSRLGARSVDLALAVLEREQLVQAHWEEPFRLDHGQRRFYELTDKARRPNEVLPVLFGSRLGASRLTQAIVAALGIALDGPRDNWVSGNAVAMIARVNARHIYPGPLYRTYGALERLEAAGLLERRHHITRTAEDPGAVAQRISAATGLGAAGWSDEHLTGGR